MPGFQHRPGFLTPYFFGVDATFSITSFERIVGPRCVCSATYYLGTKEEHLENKKNYRSYPDFEYACRKKDMEARSYYQNKNKANQVVTAEIVIATGYEATFKVNGVVVGTSRTTINYDKFDTDYFVDGRLVGSSHTDQNGDFYETSYTDTNGKMVGSSRMIVGVNDSSATHDSPAVNARIRDNNKINNVDMGTGNESHSLANQATAPSSSAGEHRKASAKKAAAVPMRMFPPVPEHEKKPEPTNKNDKGKGRCCSIQ